MAGGQKNRLGRWGEEQAAAYLTAQGCTVVAHNWRCAAGEVDLVVCDGYTLALVEVRTRRGERFGTPEASITARKLARMVAVAESYVYEQKWQGPWRLDVVAVRVGENVSIEWYKNVTM